jgi:hypothetical protein
MPPLTGMGERYAPRATWSCIDERNHSPVALALRVYPPRQGSGLAASPVPRPGMSTMVAPRPSLKRPGMLDEPTALLRLSSRVAHSSQGA